jgi:hypothetical protein
MNNQLLNFYKENKKLIIIISFLIIIGVYYFFFYCGWECKKDKINLIRRCHEKASENGISLNKEYTPTTEKVYNDFINLCIKLKGEIKR